MEEALRVLQSDVASIRQAIVPQDDVRQRRNTTDTVMEGIQ